MRRRWPRHRRLGPDNHLSCRPREAFAFLDSLIGSELCFETAGSLHGGRRVWALARLPEWVEVGGDQTATYVSAQNASSAGWRNAGSRRPIAWLVA